MQRSADEPGEFWNFVEQLGNVYKKPSLICHGVPRRFHGCFEQVKSGGEDLPSTLHTS